MDVATIEADSGGGSGARLLLYLASGCKHVRVDVTVLDRRAERCGASVSTH